MGMKKFVITEPTKKENESLKFPKSVFFIISNEFCERFSYYGMRTVLTLYLLYELHYSEPDAKVLYHLFTMFVYFFPVLGAIIADSWLGKFRTIFYVSCIYAVGNVILSLSSIGPLHLPQREIAITGLLLIAIGTGGIKPCVSAFGGDQFKLPKQQVQLVKFFSIFYFSINAGSLISTILTPVFRENVKCFDAESCFPLAFGVPGILMILSLVIFVIGKPLYTIKKPEGNIIVKVGKCIGHALSAKIKDGTKKEHWLDHAEDKYDRILIDDIKITLKVLVLYLPLPFFWSLFDQQGTGWTFQATRMNGDIGFTEILPDQMQVVNPLLILAFIPLFESCIYPLLSKCNLLKRPLQRLTFGMFLAALSFVITALVELQLEKTYPILPQEGQAQIRIYNAIPCNVQIAGKNNLSTSLKPGEMYQEIDFKVHGNQTFSYTLTSTNCSNINLEHQFNVLEKEMLGQFIKYGPSGVVNVEDYEDNVRKSANGYPLVRTLVNTPNGEVLSVVYKGSDGSTIISTNTSDIETLHKISPDKYTLYVNNTEVNVTRKLEIGGIYTVLIDFSQTSKPNMQVFTVTTPNTIHILWLIPQYVVITMAEIMFSITGLEFSYSQAPTSMKSLMQAAWLLTTAFGNLLVVVIEEIGQFDSQAYSFFLYAGLMLVDMFVFALLAMRYKYVKKESSSDANDEENVDTKEKGHDNQTFKLDEATKGQ